MLCPKCNASLPDTARFCAFCGQHINAPVLKEGQQIHTSPKKGFNKLFVILPVIAVFLAIATVAVILSFNAASGYRSSYIVTPENKEYASECRSILEERLRGNNEVRNVNVTLTDISGIHIEYSCDSEDIANGINENLLRVGKLRIAYSGRMAGSSFISNEHIEKATVEADANSAGKYQILLKFTDEGSTIFAGITEQSVGQELPIWVDDQIISSPKVNEAITGGSCIISNLTEDEAQNLCTLLNDQPLPCKVNKGFQ